MKFLGMTQGTASWLLGKPGVLDEVHSLLVAEDVDVTILDAAEFVQGPMRLSCDLKASLLALWNVEYASSAGDEPWGFITLDGEFGLTRRRDISREVLERAIYVASQRLQGLLIDGAFIHRAWANGAHTCLAGRGSDARQVSLGYTEREVQDASALIHCLLAAGPGFELNRLADETVATAGALATLLPAARRLSAPTRRKTTLPVESFQGLRLSLVPYFGGGGTSSEFSDVRVSIGPQAVPEAAIYRTVGWTYSQWIAAEGPLSPLQRRLLLGDALDRHPVRITGPAGSGKTLLMQLLALRRLSLAREQAAAVRILYLAHNEKLAGTLRHRFEMLQADRDDWFATGSKLEVRTLSDYGLAELGLQSTQVIDTDAHEAKEMQLELLREAVKDTLGQLPSELVAASRVFSAIAKGDSLFDVVIQLAMNEVSTAIKGHGHTTSDEARYVNSERALSRFHGTLSQADRTVMFRAFRRYQEVVRDHYGVFDSDDVAVSLLGKLRTPIWELQRRVNGYDFVFVDEAQLFNENERRVLPFLTKRTQPYVPIVLALDNAQNLYGQTSSGLATIGIENISSETLEAVFRSSRAIVRLAFFVIQRSTDLFGADFPDFTGLASGAADDDEEKVQTPRVEVPPADQASFPRFVLKRVQALRKEGHRHIGVICFFEPWWKELVAEFSRGNLAVQVMEARGERINGGVPQVVIARPPHVGGQEFDAVVIVGVEEGQTPARVLDNDALAQAVEQQALRELYLAITRARYAVVFALRRGALICSILASAKNANLVLEATPGEG